MADFAHSLRRTHASSNKISNGNTFTSKNVYEDVFGGASKFEIPTFSSRLEDYSEIFSSYNSSRGYSIPFLDLPDVDETGFSTDVRSSEFDYSEIFGGFDSVDYAVPYEELFLEPKAGESSSEDVWTPAETGSPSEESSEDHACSENNQAIPNISQYAYDGVKQFNMSYHKTNQLSKEDGISGTTYIAQLNAVPAYTLVVDDVPFQTSKCGDSLTDVVNDHSLNAKITDWKMDEERFCETTPAQPSRGSDQKPQQNVEGSGTCNEKPFLSISDISLRTHPSEVPPPSRPPPNLTFKQGSHKLMELDLKPSSSSARQGAASDSSPPFFDVEIDLSSSAAASAAAMKEAMEKAQARLKSAKELMERKKDGLQHRKKMKMKEESKGNERREGVTADDVVSVKEEKSQVALELEVKPRLFTVSEESVDHKYAKDRRLTRESQRKELTGEWKAEEQFYELVKKDTGGTVLVAPEHKKGDRNSIPTTRVCDHEKNEKKAEKVASVQQEERYLKLQAAKGELEEDRRILDVAKEACERGAEHEERIKAARKIRDQPVHKEIQKRADEVKESEEKLKEVCEREEREKKIKGTREQEKKEAHERQDYEKNLKEAHELEELEKNLNESREREKNEKKRKDALQREENDRMQRETCEREENDKEEALEREENERRQKEARDKVENEKKVSEKKQREASEREENERRKREAREREENEKRISEKKEREARQKEENERRQREDREREEDERRQKEAREREENERRQKEAREREESERRQKEARKREENERRRKEECERQENEKRINEKKETEAREREDNERRQTEAREREENERRQKELMREEFERKRKQAAEENERRLKEIHEREENKRKQNEELEREENERKQNEELEREENESRLKEAYEREETERKFKQDAEKNDRKLKEVHEKEENEKTRKEAHDRGENEKRPKEPCQEVVNEKLLQKETCERWENDQPDLSRDFHVCNEEDKNLSAEAVVEEITGCENKLMAESDACMQDEIKNSEALCGGCEQEESNRKLKLAEALCENENYVKTMKTAQNAVEHRENVKNCKEDKVSCDQDENETLRGAYITQSSSEHEEFMANQIAAPNKVDDSEKKSGETEAAEVKCTKKDLTVSDCKDGKKIMKVFPRVKIEVVEPTNVEEKTTKPKLAGDINPNQEKKGKSLNGTFTREGSGTEGRIAKEREQEKERMRKLEEDREREREREKDRMAVERVTREARERAYIEARERAAVERATAEARQRAMAEARERLEKACAEAREKSLAEKASSDARIRAERATVERAIAEARERAVEKAMAERAEKFSATSRDSVLRDTRFQSSSSQRYPSSSNHGGFTTDKSQGAEVESAQRCKARLERHQRAAERAANALAEKNLRDHVAQREQAERNRLSETLDADVKRWSSGKEGNLRALLSTLQYILGGESGWQPVPLTDVITAVAVKKAYRKATLYVHPDKLQQRGASIQHKYICEKVFDLLKDAWNKFNSEER